MDKISFVIDHIAFSVQNMEKSVEFYNLFGFGKVREWMSEDLAMQMVLMENSENTLLELVWCKDGKPLPDYAKDYIANLQYIGIKHLALCVQSVDQTLAFLRNNGITNSSDIQIGKLGRKFFFYQ